MLKKEQKTEESDERDRLKSKKRERRGGKMVEGGTKEHPPEAGLIYDCNSVFEVDGVLMAQCQITCRITGQHAWALQCSDPFLSLGLWPVLSFALSSTWALAIR